MEIILNLTSVIKWNWIRLLNPKKARAHNIPPKILKSCSEATVNVLHRLFHETVTKCVLRDNLKLNDVIPVFN